MASLVNFCFKHFTMLNQHFDHGLMQCMLTDPILEQSHCYQCVFHTLMLFHDATARGWCSEVFKVRSCCYVTRLVLELTVWCSRTVRFFAMFDMFEVRFWAKMWCSESSMFGHSMFGVFEVRYFGVHSKTSFSQDSREHIWQKINKG